MKKIRDKTKFGLVKEHFSFGFESLGVIQQLRHLYFSEGYPSKLKPQPKNWFSYNPPSMDYPRLRDCLSSPSMRDGILRGLSEWCPRIVCCHRRDRNLHHRHHETGFFVVPVGFFVIAVCIEEFWGSVVGLFVGSRQGQQRIPSRR